MILGTVEVLDTGYVFKDLDGKTRACADSDSLSVMLKNCMLKDLLLKAQAGAKYSFEMNKIA